MEFEQGDLDHPIWSGCWYSYADELPPDLLALPYKKVMLKTEGDVSITLDDSPGAAGITLETSGAQKVKILATGIEIDNGQGATIKLNGPQVSVNNTVWRTAERRRRR